MLSHLQRGIIVFVAIAAVSVGSARASPLHRPMEHCTRQQAAKTELHCARRAFYANSGEARWIRNHARRTTGDRTLAHYWHTRLRFLDWRAQVDRRLIVEARGRLAPPRPAIDGCLSQLIARESGGNVHATNPSSGAYGLPQALPGSKMASAGSDWRDNAATQIRWMVGYVNARYGGACNALAYQIANGFY